MAALETQTILAMKVIDEDDGSTIAERALVDVNGESAVVRRWDEERRRYVQTDRLTECKLKRARKGVILLTGTSQHLLRTVRVGKEAAQMRLKIVELDRLAIDE